MQKFIRTWNTQSMIYNFQCSQILNKIILIKSFLTEVLYDCFKLVFAYLNEGGQVCEFYSCLKMVIQAHLHVGIFTLFFIKRASLKRFYLYLKRCNQAPFFKLKNNC